MGERDNANLLICLVKGCKEYTFSLSGNWQVAKCRRCGKEIRKRFKIETYWNGA